MPDGSVDYGKDAWLAAWDNENEVEHAIHSLCDACLKAHKNSINRCNRRDGSTYHICREYAKGSCNKKIHHDGKHLVAHIRPAYKFEENCTNVTCKLGHNLLDVRTARVAAMTASVRKRRDVQHTQSKVLKRSIAAEGSEDGHEWRVKKSR